MTKESNDRVIVIGAGYGGLSAAFELARQGIKVLVLEKEAAIGGLAGTFELPQGARLEKFYHHWFTSDTDILDFIRELQLGDRIRYIKSNTGLYFANSIFRLSSPLDLLRFHPLPFLDRIRTGLMALLARRINDWKGLEGSTAEEWILKVGGRKSYEVIWKPLLKGKFGPEAPNVSAVWFWNKLKLRGSSRGKEGGESLAYFEGGFGAVTEAIKAALESQGVEIRTGVRVREIKSDNSEVTGVVTDDGFLPAKAVLGTAPLPIFLEMTPGLPEDYRQKAAQIRFLGNVCLVLRLKRSLSETYWLNVADPDFPFVGIIEHTNFDSKDNYGGEYIAYLSKYLPVSDPMFRMENEDLLEYCIPFIKKMFPAFDRSWLHGFEVWRAEHSQPVITRHYSSLIPASETPIKNLWLCTMAQVYPEDRGTNYAVRYGRRVGKEMAGLYRVNL